SHITYIRAGKRQILRFLKWGIFKLIRPGSPAKYRSFLPHPDGRVPPVDAFQIAGFGGNITDGFYIFQYLLTGLSLITTQCGHQSFLVPPQNPGSQDSCKDQVPERYFQPNKEIQRCRYHQRKYRRPGIRKYQNDREYYIQTDPPYSFVPTDGSGK